MAASFRWKRWAWSLVDMLWKMFLILFYFLIYTGKQIIIASSCFCRRFCCLRWQRCTKTWCHCCSVGGCTSSLYAGVATFTRWYTVEWFISMHNYVFRCTISPSALRKMWRLCWTRWVVTFGNRFISYVCGHWLYLWCATVWAGLVIDVQSVSAVVCIMSNTARFHVINRGISIVSTQQD